MLLAALNRQIIAALCIQIENSESRLCARDWSWTLQTLGFEQVTSWLRSQVSDGGLTFNILLIVDIIECRACESGAASLSVRGGVCLKRKAFLWLVISKGCSSECARPRIEKAIVDNLWGVSYAQSFHVKMGGLVSCKNIWPPSSPLLPALYPLALPINASITPHRHAEEIHWATDPELSRGHLPAKRRRPIVLNVISSNVLLPQHWSMLTQHNLQVDLLPLPDLITAPRSTPMIETTDLLIQLGHPSGVI